MTAMIDLVGSFVICGMLLLEQVRNGKAKLARSAEYAYTSQKIDMRATDHRSRTERRS